MVNYTLGDDVKSHPAILYQRKNEFISIHEETQHLPLTSGQENKRDKLKWGQSSPINTVFSLSMSSYEACSYRYFHQGKPTSTINSHTVSTGTQQQINTDIHAHGVSLVVLHLSLLFCCFTKTLLTWDWVTDWSSLWRDLLWPLGQTSLSYSVSGLIMEIHYEAKGSSNESNVFTAHAFRFIC